MPCHPATGLVVAERQQDTFARGEAEFGADPVRRVALAVPQMRGVEAELETVIAEFVVQTALDQLRGGIGRRAGMGADLLVLAGIFAVDPKVGVDLVIRIDRP